MRFLNGEHFWNQQIFWRQGSKQRKIPLWTGISGLFVLLWVSMAEGMLRMVVTHSVAKCASLKPIFCFGGTRLRSWGGYYFGISGIIVAGWMSNYTEEINLQGDNVYMAWLLAMRTENCTEARYQSPNNIHMPHKTAMRRQQHLSFHSCFPYLQFRRPSLRQWLSPNLFTSLSLTAAWTCFCWSNNGSLNMFLLEQKRQDKESDIPHLRKQPSVTCYWCSTN